MELLDLTLPTPEDNLALDEALLDLCERGGCGPILRFWEPASYFVVLGYGNRAESEVHLHSCRRDGVPVFRRCSGGGTVLQGVGSLNYAVLTPVTEGNPFKFLGREMRAVLERHRTVLAQLSGDEVAVAGVSDLAMGRRKISGNAQRRRRHFLLTHGTVLIDFNLSRMDAYLALPSRQPAYRAGRSHADFVTNTGIDRVSLKNALASAWGAVPTRTSPMQLVSDDVFRHARARYQPAL